MRAIAVHGGAGTFSGRREDYREGLRQAIAAGWGALEHGGTALDAVVAATCALEDDPHFNAGTGSVLTLEGTVEADAAVMKGDGEFGAVGALRGVRNPVKVARAVMEKTDHLFLAGDGALSFARQLGFPPANLVTTARVERWEQDYARLRAGEAKYWRRLAEALREPPKPGPTEPYSTVGAVACDAQGRVASATSTGGISLKLPGRIGDTPVMGAGTFAGAAGAASATGHGEGILRLGITRLVVERLADLPAPQAVDAVVALARERGVDVGLITVDRSGRIGIGFNTPEMAYAHRTGEETVVFEG